MYWNQFIAFDLVGTDVSLITSTTTTITTATTTSSTTATVQQGAFSVTSLQKCEHFRLFISGYFLIEVPTTQTCDYITTSAECEAAAVYLGLPDISATPSPITSYDPQVDPPYCYIENGDLKFNGDGTNAGACGSDGGFGAAYLDKCLCKILITTTATTTTTTPTTTTATTTVGCTSSRCTCTTNNCQDCRNCNCCGR